ncbi:MAG TPA: YceI family protein [Pirellulales bacterium]|nr:YceI family protein [Pirellulales bacterium]
MKEYRPACHVPVAWVALIALAASGASSVCAASYAVDPVHSTVLFRVKHMGTSFAWGRFNEIVGRLNLDDQAPSVEMLVKTESLDTANAKRDQHLKSPDFFSAKQFPAISFKSTRVARAGENKYDVEGTLSLHGVDRPLKVQLERTGAGKNPIWAAPWPDTPPASRSSAATLA